MNDQMIEHIRKALAKGVRRDGRDLLEFRDVEIETGVSSTSHGSARVRAGEGELIAGVKISTGTPYPDTPNKGALMVSAEMLALSHRKFEGGRPGIDSIEAARVTDRTIRESEVIDLEELCIVPGEKIWMVSVDLAPINYDGNIIDLGVIATMAALRDARFPVMDDDGNVDLETLSDKKLPLQGFPISVTIFKYGDTLLVDPTEVEERHYDARLTIGSLEDGKLCSLQKGGEGPVTVEDLEKMFKTAVDIGKDIRKQFK